jgi:hypothetical protein
MIRIEYTIDGKFWNHIATDFTSYAHANKYIDSAGIRDFATQIKFLTITKEEIIEVSKN